MLQVDGALEYSIAKPSYFDQKLLLDASSGFNLHLLISQLGFPGGSVVKNPPVKAGSVKDGGSVAETGRSPGGGNGNTL